ncbi:MAG: hypothetical protein ACOC5T_01035 [Elusimicrobiota bacterium]
MEELDVYVYLEPPSNTVYILTKGRYNGLIMVDYNDCINEYFSSVERIWFEDVENEHDYDLDKFIVANKVKFEKSGNIEFVSHFEVEGKASKLSRLVTDRIIKVLTRQKPWYNGGILL